MKKVLLIMAAILLANAVSAQNCPVLKKVYSD